jgi:hypothetical protein
VAYRLQLPDHSSVHPVVHVSQLRRAAGFKGSVSTQLPAIASQFRIPQQVLGSRLITRGANQVAQVRVRWSELPDDLATWEDYVALKQAFRSLRLLLGVKQAFKNRGVSGLPMRKDPRSSSDREMEPTGDRAGLLMRKDPRSSSDREMEPTSDRAGPRRLTCESLVQNGSKPVCVCEAR